MLISLGVDQLFNISVMLSDQMVNVTRHRSDKSCTWQYTNYSAMYRMQMLMSVEVSFIISGRNRSPRQCLVTEVTYSGISAIMCVSIRMSIGQANSRI